MTAELAEQLLQPVTDEEAADDGAEDCETERHTWDLPLQARA